MQSVTINKAAGKRNDAAKKLDLDLADLFRTYHPRIYNYLRYRVSSVEDAEDLIGAVFEQAYARRAQFDPAKGAFSSWLFRIAHNALIDQYRQQERRQRWETETGLPPDLVTPEPSPEAQLVQQENIAHLLRSLKHLRERDQEIISLKFAGKLKNKEIAEVMDMKEKTVSVVLLRAMRRLRDQMTEEVTQ